MNRQQFAGREEQVLRRYEYDDRYVVAADLGVTEQQVDVDIVGETALVVIETENGVQEAEFGLPDSDGDAAVNNGVLTITVPK
jgi:HSP20 family molecular chaperone IbpA